MANVTKLKQEIEKRKEAIAKLEEELNTESLKELNDALDKVTTTLAIVMLDDDDLDLSGVSNRLKKLLNATIGKDRQVKIEKKPTAGNFVWENLVTEMKKAKVSKANPATRKELEELYFNGDNVVFNQKFNNKEEKEKYIKSEGSAASKKYWV